MGATWQDDTTLVVDGVTFIAGNAGRFASTSDRFCLVKRHELVDSHLALYAELQPERIFELGVFQGGSTALAALVTDPALLLAVEYEPDRITALDQLLASRDLAARVRMFYGVDQADTAALRAILDEHAADVELDLVIDDASHFVPQTRASFNVLFPRLRPGGVYVIEDWSWAHIGFGSAAPDEEPLTRLVFEIAMALPTCEGLISEIRIDRDSTFITRGDRPIEGDFDIAACVTDRGYSLLAPSP